ncbi:hypothetical protein ACFL0Y_01040 [Patescibacteria group bacterium]
MEKLNSFENHSGAERLEGLEGRARKLEDRFREHPQETACLDWGPAVNRAVALVSQRNLEEDLVTAAKNGTPFCTKIIIRLGI